MSGVAEPEVFTVHYRGFPFGTLDPSYSYEVELVQKADYDKLKASYEAKIERYRMYLQNMINSICAICSNDCGCRDIANEALREPNN